MYRSTLIKHLLFSLVALFVLNGCSMLSMGSKKGSGKVAINWYCVKDEASGTQTCQKRRMSDGRPVDREIFETIVIPGDQVVENIPKPVHQPPSNAGNAIPWRRQPLASVNSIDDPAALKVENLGPQMREVRATADVWGKSKPATPSAEKQAVATGPNAGYTLQMAAFATQQRCDSFIAKNKARNFSIHTRMIKSQNANWCIVTHGKFASQAEAVSASRTFVEKYPDMSFWVRSWASIKALEVTQ